MPSRAGSLGGCSGTWFWNHFALPISDIILDHGAPAGPIKPKVSSQCGHMEKHPPTSASQHLPS